MTQKTVKAIPLVYHGSPNNFDTFNSKKLGTATDKYDDPNISSSLGFFFTTDKQYAKNYAIGENGVLYTCKLSINNPFVYDMEDYIATDRKIAAVITEGKEKGHDSVILLNIRELGRPKATEYVVFNPTQIEIKRKEAIKNITERLESLANKTGYITGNSRDIANLLKNKPKDYRILYDRNIDMYMIGDGNDIIHYDLLLSAYHDAYYYNMEDFINSLGGFDNYIEIGQDGGWNAEDEEIEPYLYYIVFTQDEDWTLGTDGYDKKYDYDFGHILTRGCDLSEITLWDTLGVPLNSEKLHESNEYVQLSKLLEKHL